MKLNGMPNEDYKIQRGYEPNTVKVRPIMTLEERIAWIYLNVTFKLQ